VRGYRGLGRLGLKTDGVRFGPLELDRIVSIWRITRSQVRRSLHGSYSANTQMQFCRDGRLLVTRTGSSIHFWDVRRCRKAASVPLGSHHGVTVRRDRMITAGPSGVLLWPMREEVPGTLRVGPARRLCALRARDDIDVGPISVSDDGRHLALREAIGRAVILDLEQGGQRTREFSLVNLNGIDLSPDGRWLAAGPFRGYEVRVWDARSGDEVHRLPAPVDYFSAEVVFSRDGRRLLVATQTDCHVFETGTWKTLRRYQRGDVAEVPVGAALGQDSRTLVVTSSVRSLALRDLETHRLLVELPVADRGMPSAAAVAPDGSLVACAIQGYGIEIWDIRRLRHELGELGLDWEGPPFFSEKPPDSEPALNVEVDLGDLASPPK